MDDRVERLEDQVSGLREDRAAQSAEIRHLATAVEDLSSTVQELRDTMNKGRGALWGMSGVAALLGGAASIAANKFFGG